MDYGMFSKFGNDAVHTIVSRARMLHMDWDQVYDALEVLAKTECFAEATDTAVREAVYIELGFDK